VGEKQKILFIIGSLDIGGAERQLTVLADRIRAFGYSSLVFSFQGDGILAGFLEKKGVALYNGGLKKGDVRKAPWKLLRTQWRMMTAIRSIKPDVLHSFLPLATFMGAVAGRMGDVPLVVTSRRALTAHQRRVPFLKPLDRLADKLSHRVTVNSKAVWRDAVERNHANPSKLVLVYNGVDPVPFQKAMSCRDRVRRDLGIEADWKVLISIANLIPYKGHADLLKAFKAVSLEFPRVKLLLVGEDRGIQAHLERSAYEMQVSSLVEYLGRQEDVAPLLAASDISVLPSHEEGFSNVILESMAAGLPVVATHVGGNAEAVVHGMTGWLVPPRKPAEMAERITNLLKDPYKAEEWGKRGKERVLEHFTIERMVERHAELYEKSFVA
jgi:glycosyltransferase involved in cell wall biosynthesis